MAPGVWPATTRMASRSRPDEPTQARPTGRTFHRSSILGQRYAPEFRRTAERLEEENRTDHVLHKPDKLTRYLHSLPKERLHNGPRGRGRKFTPPLMS